MSLITCPECGREISDKAQSCPQCGFPIKQDLSEESNGKYSIVLKEPVPFSSQSSFMMTLVIVSKGQAKNIKTLISKPESILLSGLSKDEAYRKHSALSMQDVVLEIREEETQLVVEPRLVCPKCGSSSVKLFKKGFGFGKAALGVALTGPVGALGGAIGSNKSYRQCAVCGHKF